jgi:hypothetical protein
MNALAQSLGATILRTAGPGGGTAVVIEFPANATQASMQADRLPSLTDFAGKEKREGDE